ncbi:hypothetical protein G4D82_11260 [Flavobacterium sp. CYK-4]|uniref:hypothetical protein n=1 Tax=Flavobacterium lotistagni TaxID=2709660 RepID=UPI00140DAD5A|nr:hypothetical protein [Flavobacterium lotistagni]NHM07800.1 hypothetical protein [Flavobacterium lotistagni]
MNLKPYRPLAEVVLLSLLAFVLHVLLLPFFVKDISSFEHSITFLYSFFTVCSLLIVLTLVRISLKKKDSVGHTFMLLTCIKMVLAYVLLHPILNSARADIKIEKINFFLIFALFLTIETTVAIRMLNKLN